MKYSVSRHTDSVSINLDFDQLYSLIELLSKIDGEPELLRWIGLPLARQAVDLDDTFQTACEAYQELTGSEHPDVEPDEEEPPVAPAAAPFATNYEALLAALSAPYGRVYMMGHA